MVLMIVTVINAIEILVWSNNKSCISPWWTVSLVLDQHTRAPLIVK